MAVDGIYDVSALVVSYNPNYEKLVTTIKSLLLQQDIRLQIVVADDGSKEDYFDELIVYFAENDFTNYCLVKNQENQGIVKNFLSGLRKCEGDYVKPISPGDYMACATALFDWISYMEKNQITVCGADYICYCNSKDGKMEPVKRRLNPQIVGLSVKRMRINYLINDDIFLGAATLCKRELLLLYVLILEHSVKYAEDNCYRVMAYCGEHMGFYKRPMLLYEVGTGVSTSGENKWKILLKKDWAETDNIMLNMNSDDKKMKKIFKSYIKMKNLGGGVLSLPSLL